MRVTPQLAGWELLHFSARRLAAGRTWTWDTGENELALVTLGGALRVRSNRGEWQRIGRRADVFSGMPYCLYLPRRTQFEVEALEPVGGNTQFSAFYRPHDHDGAPGGGRCASLAGSAFGGDPGAGSGAGGARRGRDIPLADAAFWTGISSEILSARVDRQSVRGFLVIWQKTLITSPYIMKII